MKWLPGINIKKLTKDQKDKLFALLKMRKVPPMKEKDGSASHNAKKKKKPADGSQ